MNIAEKLRAAGLVVIEGRSFGRIEEVEGINVLLTRTGAQREGAEDINGIVAQNRGTFYVERSGRVWMLAQGPVANQTHTLIYQAAHTEATDEQADATEALIAVLEGVYTMTEPVDTDAPDPIPTDSDGNPVEVIDEGE